MKLFLLTYNSLLILLFTLYMQLESISSKVFSNHFKDNKTIYKVKTFWLKEFDVYDLFPLTKADEVK